MLKAVNPTARAGCCCCAASLTGVGHAAELGLAGALAGPADTGRVDGWRAGVGGCAGMGG
eukprot:351104-Chlamydomonas_euryale.AAC.3